MLPFSLLIVIVCSLLGLRVCIYVLHCRCSMFSFLADTLGGGWVLMGCVTAVGFTLGCVTAVGLTLGAALVTLVFINSSVDIWSRYCCA